MSNLAHYKGRTVALREFLARNPPAFIRKIYKEALEHCNAVISGIEDRIFVKGTA